MQILGYLNGGFGEVESWKVEVRQNELRRAALQALLTAAASEPQPPALHPKMAGVFEQKIRTLAAALEHEDLETRESARSALRGFIDHIVIPPGDELLRVVGNLGEMLTAAGAAVGKGGCGGTQPPVLAAVERGGVMRSIGICDSTGVIPLRSSADSSGAGWPMLSAAGRLTDDAKGCLMGIGNQTAHGLHSW